MTYFASSFGVSLAPGDATHYLWLIFLIYWLVAALKRKPTKRRESIAQRLLYMLPLLVGYILLSWADDFHGFLRARFLPDSLAIAWFGVALTAAGIGLAFWARNHLGSNWSGVVTLKEGHELIRTGPYRTIRHPIYTGIFLALIGTAIVVGEWRAIVGVALAIVTLSIKAKREESFLSDEFGPNFLDHKQQTGMFLPKFRSH